MKKTEKIELDWSRLLGFDQAVKPEGGRLSLRDASLAKVGKPNEEFVPPGAFVRG